MSTQGPVLVRINDESQTPVRPVEWVFGARLRHRIESEIADSSGSKRLKWFRIVFLAFGLVGLSYYGFTLADEHVYQAYQNWAFEQQIAGRPSVTFSSYLHEKTPFGGLAGPTPAPLTEVSMAHVNAPPTIRPAIGSLLGRVEVPRLSLSAIVREGSDAATLSRAVGHVPSTSLVGRDGNVAIAAHRDTLFRALKDIQKDDTVNFETSSGTYRYKVFSTKVVKPSEISVLRPDAGLPASVLQGNGNPKQLLTMITCYPFSYVGSAPERFIVTARLIGEDIGSPAPTAAHPALVTTQRPVPALAPVAPSVLAAAAHSPISHGTSRHAPHRARSTSRIAPRATGQQNKSAGSQKRRNLWRRVLHLN